MEQFKDKELAKEKSFHVMFNMQEELSVSARMLYITLMAVDRDQIIRHEQLAELTRVSIPTVKNSIKELLANELILQTRTQGGCFYVVI